MRAGDKRPHAHGIMFTLQENLDRFITAKHTKLGFKPRSTATYTARSVTYGDQHNELFYLI